MAEGPVGYDDIDAHVERLKALGLVCSVDRAIDKDTEMHPLVRWQYRGGIAEADRKAFLFTNVVDATGRSYPGARVAIGALAGNRQIYALGMKRPEAEIGKAWLDAIA
ncbi:MAG: UbiD family decarboxylase, partial [Reyranella sp.]